MMPIRPRHILVTTAVVFALFAVAACGGGSKAATTVATQAPARTAPAVHTQQATAMPATPTPSVAALTGLGLTSKAFSKLHKEDKARNPGTSYDRQSNGDDRFAAVQQDTGVVTAFNLQYPAGTSLADLTKAALAQLPADAKLVAKASPGTCELLLYQSAALGKAWSAPSFGDADGYAGIVLSALTGDGTWDGVHADTAGLSLADPRFTKGTC